MLKNYIIGAAIILLSCEITKTGENGNAVGDKSYPKTFKELKVEYYDGGGMLPEYERITISNDTATWEHTFDYEQETANWKPSQAELDELFTVFVANDYKSITTKSESGEIYDRGGVDLTITIDGNQTRISNSGSSFIDEKWFPNYNAICGSIWKQVNAHKPEE